MNKDKESFEKEYRKLIEETNYYTKLYDEGNPQISDEDWDYFYFRILALERLRGFADPDSPTQSINYQVVNKLNKVSHNHPMLSLNKTKDLKDVESFIGEKDYIAMCKLDGLTCSLRYLDGKLVSAETRGDGMIGEDILHNILTLPSVPKKIFYKQELIVDGEIICKTDDFKEFANEYKNPRNFAAGSIRLLDSKECSKRKLTFVVWDVIKGFENDLVCDYLHNALIQLTHFGFETVPCIAFCDTWEEDVETIIDMAHRYEYPIDGVVFKFDSRSYGKELGRTEHHFKNAIAYKFYDEEHRTRVNKIEWTMGRTGVLTPIAIVDPIEIDGTLISRVSLHNLSVLKASQLQYQGQEVDVFKANQIIPQISKVYPYEEDIGSIDGMEIPNTCPYCGGKTEIVETETSTVLKCSNPQCQSKLINKLDHYCGKKGMDIKGLSKATLNKLIDWNWVNSISDLYELEKYKKEWSEKPGFGVKSVSNILSAIEKSKETPVWRFISGFGIPLIGATYAKQIEEKCQTLEGFLGKIEDKYDFSTWEGFGEEMNHALLTFDYSEFKKLSKKMIFKIPPKTKNNLTESIPSSLKGINIVITGKLQEFKNREALKEEIEKYGGKVLSGVSSKVNYLINNDTESQSAKNKKAKELDIPILSEKSFIEKFLTL